MVLKSMGVCPTAYIRLSTDLPPPVDKISTPNQKHPFLHKTPTQNFLGKNSQPLHQNHLDFPHYTNSQKTVNLNNTMASQLDNPAITKVELPLADFATENMSHALAKATPTEASQNRIEKRLTNIQKKYYPDRSVDPLEFLVHVMMGGDKHINESEGAIQLGHKVKAAETVLKYVHPQLKSMEVSMDVDITANIQSTQKTMVAVVDLLGQLSQTKAVEGAKPVVIEQK